MAERLLKVWLSLEDKVKVEAIARHRHLTQSQLIRNLIRTLPSAGEVKTNDERVNERKPENIFAQHRELIVILSQIQFCLCD